MITTTIEIRQTKADGTSRVIAKMQQQDSDYTTKYEARVTVTPPEAVEAE